MPMPWQSRGESVAIAWDGYRGNGIGAYNDDGSKTNKMVWTWSKRQEIKIEIEIEIEIEMATTAKNMPMVMMMTKQ